MDIKNLSVNLENKILGSEKVIIIPHNNADMDAIGSAIGLSLIPQKLNKKSHIILNDPPHVIEAGVKLIVQEALKEFSIIDKEKYSKVHDNNDLYVLADTNRGNRISINEYINNPENVIIIDHHNENETTVDSNYKYIDTSVSSASEVVAKLLLDNYEMKIPKNVANYLLAGIYLDTNHLNERPSADLFKIVAKLLENGADPNRVNEYFTEDFVSDRKVQDLVGKLQMSAYRIATAVADEETMYTREELAKVADYALKYGVDASFAIGYIEDKIISISGRSRGKIDIGGIMKELGGGGNQTSGAAKISDETLEESNKKLQKLLQPNYYIGIEN